MKYFTKEWVRLCGKMGSPVLLEESKEAQVFSQEYFEQLYKQKLSEWLISEEVIDSLLAEQDRSILSEPLERVQFSDLFLSNQQRIKKVLPEEILEQIADIRVFALGKASSQVINAVTRFCKENEKSVNKTLKEYQKYAKKALRIFDKSVVENINFHDCKIIGIKQSDQALTIFFDNAGSFTDINEVQFENFQILKQEASLINAWWIYDEIYKTGDRYELQVLLDISGINSKLIEFNISAEHISFKRNQKE